jgi:hypothetical protein
MGGNGNTTGAEMGGEDFGGVSAHVWTVLDLELCFLEGSIPLCMVWRYICKSEAIQR